MHAFLSAIQGDHHSCYSESPCRQPHYVQQKKPLTMPAAISAYEGALRKTLIYKWADSFHRVCIMNKICHDQVYVFFFPVSRHLLGGVI